MKNLESVFVKEFGQSVKAFRDKNIYTLPLPKESIHWTISGTDEYMVQGVEEKYYLDLNKTIVRRLPRGKEAKRRVIDKVTRSFKLDENGGYVYEDYKVPSGSVVVVSTTKIKLPYSNYIKSENGFGYIDFIAMKNGIAYMYVLPKSVLYKVNQTALALSVKNMKNYSGMGYKTWTMGEIFLHVIPYNPNSQYTGSKILKTGRTLNYTSEVESIVKLWIQEGIIPELSLCKLTDGRNLAVKQTMVGYDSYIPVESLSLNEKEIYGNDTNQEGEERGAV